MWALVMLWNSYYCEQDSEIVLLKYIYVLLLFITVSLQYK